MSGKPKPLKEFHAFENSSLNPSLCSHEFKKRNIGCPKSWVNGLRINGVWSEYSRSRAITIDNGYWAIKLEHTIILSNLLNLRSSSHIYVNFLPPRLNSCNPVLLMNSLKSLAVR